jgi:transposase
MYVECARVKGRKDYLRVSETYSMKEDGIRKTKKRVIYNIGPLDVYDDGLPNYVDRLKESFRNGNPIIDEISHLASKHSNRRFVSIKFDRNNVDESMLNPKNIGYFMLDSLYDALGIYDVMIKHKSKNKIKYDINGLTKLLVFSRVLSPASKLSTFHDKDDYLFSLTSSNNLKDVYNLLSELDKIQDSIQKRIRYKIDKEIKINKEICYYDVTNYYFEIDKNDEDTIDKKGNIIDNGLRKKGVSKENRHEPIVQMGLFIDDRGIPIGYKLFPGNNIDQTTYRPTYCKTIDKMNFDRVIIVADGGLNSSMNIKHILDNGNGYIISKSIKKSDKETKAWILNDNGYRYNDKGSFKVKSMIRKRVVKDVSGNMREIEEKLVSFWSKKHYDKEMHENKKFIEYLESVIDNPDKLKDKQKKIEKFLRKEQVIKQTGEIVKTTTHISLETEKIKEYMASLGYYTIMTSEINKTDEEIIDKYRGLSKIEDSFRVTKTDLKTRPVYVYTKEHINAHFLICFIALTMIRLIQYKVKTYENIDAISLKQGVTADKIKYALQSFQVTKLPSDYFLITKPTEEMKLILDAFKIDMNLSIPNISNIRQLKLLIDKAKLT